MEYLGVCNLSVFVSILSSCSARTAEEKIMVYFFLLPPPPLMIHLIVTVMNLNKRIFTRVCILSSPKLFVYPRCTHRKWSLINTLRVSVSSINRSCSIHGNQTTAQILQKNNNNKQPRVCSFKIPEVEIWLNLNHTQNDFFCQNCRHIEYW